MSAKALKYAEETLHVHEVFTDTVELTEQLDILLADLDKAQDRKRQLNEDYADREVALISEMRGKHPSMSDTRFKSEFKSWERVDKELHDLRVQLNEVHSSIQGYEYDKALLELRIRVGSARMVELGGYFQYLAAVKLETQAEKTTKPQEKQ